MESKPNLQAALSSFARARRIRMLQVVGACLLFFAIGVLVGMSINYKAVRITVEDLPAAVPPESDVTADTIRT
jgi:hypothetical protein